MWVNLVEGFLQSKTAPAPWSFAVSPTNPSADSP